MKPAATLLTSIALFALTAPLHPQEKLEQSFSFTAPLPTWIAPGDGRIEGDRFILGGRFNASANLSRGDNGAVEVLIRTDSVAADAIVNLILRATGETSYVLSYKPKGAKGLWMLLRRQGKDYPRLAETEVPALDGIDHLVRLECADRSLRVFLDGRMILAAEDPQPLQGTGWQVFLKGVRGSLAAIRTFTGIPQAPRAPEGANAGDAPAPRAARDLWVDAASSEEGDGTMKKPFRRIQQAAELAGPGDMVRVKPGVYRERVKPARGGTREHPIVYRSEIPRQAVVKGSDTWSPVWKSEGDGLYSAAVDEALFTDTAYVDGGNPLKIPYNWMRKGRLPPAPFAAVEWTLGQLFRDGQALPERSSREELAAAPGAWWYDAASGRLVAHWGGEAPAKGSLELSTRRGVFRPYAKGLEYIEVHGFVFEHCANQFPADFWTKPEWEESGMVGTRSGRYWTFRSNVFRHAKSIGLTFGGGASKGAFDNEVPPLPEPKLRSEGHLIEGNVFAQNGALGAMGWQFNAVTFRSNLFTGNNALLNTSYESGGIKTHGARDLVIEGNAFLGNDAMGIWIDNGWKNVRILRNVFHGNRGKDVMFEMESNTLDTASLAAFNLFLPGRAELLPSSKPDAPDAPWKPTRSGIYSHEADGILIQSNFFAGEAYGIYSREMGPRRGGASFIRAAGNIFCGEGDYAAVCLPIETEPFVVSNAFEGNFYPAVERPFVLTGWVKGWMAEADAVSRILEWTRKAGPEPLAFGADDKPPQGYRVNLAQWRAATGFDRRSLAGKVDWSLDWKANTFTVALPPEAENFCVGPFGPVGRGRQVRSLGTWPAYP